MSKTFAIVNILQDFTFLTDSNLGQYVRMREKDFKKRLPVASDLISQANALTEK